MTFAKLVEKNYQMKILFFLYMFIMLESLYSEKVKVMSTVSLYICIKQPSYIMKNVGFLHFFE